jgi:hypothetical protein
MSTPEPESLTDAQLDTLFAVEVANLDAAACGFLEDKAPRGLIYVDDADAVLPWLAMADTWQCLYDQGEMHEYSVQVWAPNFAEASADTFPRAAVLALLKAKGAAP